jgi:hypothetical protein
VTMRGHANQLATTSVTTTKAAMISVRFTGRLGIA